MTNQGVQNARRVWYSQTIPQFTRPKASMKSIKLPINFNAIKLNGRKIFSRISMEGFKYEETDWMSANQRLSSTHQFENLPNIRILAKVAAFISLMSADLTIFTWQMIACFTSRDRNSPVLNIEKSNIEFIPLLYRCHRPNMPLIPKIPVTMLETLMSDGFFLCLKNFLNSESVLQ